MVSEVGLVQDCSSSFCAPYAGEEVTHVRIPTHPPRSTDMVQGVKLLEVKTIGDLGSERMTFPLSNIHVCVTS